MFRHAVILVGALSISVLAVGCASQKVPAETAITAAETAFAAVQAEALKYVPDQARGVTEAIASAKDAVAKGDYKAALATAQGIPPKITELTAAITAKKNGLIAAWKGLSEALPGAVEAIQSRIGILSKSKKLPAGLDAAKFEEAKSGLTAVTTDWAGATTAFGTGDLTNAVAKAETVKSKVADVMTLLGMQLPPALGGTAAK